jgi:psiF repeat
MTRCILAALFLFSACAVADDGLTADQKRMQACNTRAKDKDLKGAERSHFMTHCLKGQDGDAPKLTAHQRKNETCTRRADNRSLEGAERRGFMANCVKSERTKQRTADADKIKHCNRRAAGRRLEGEEKKKFVDGCLDGGAALGG